MRKLQSEAINAYRIIDTLNNNKFDGNTCFKIYRLKKQLKEYWDYQTEREQELFASYEASFGEDGSIVLKDMSKAEEFIQKITEMSNIEHEVTPVDIPCDVFDNISVQEIEVLDGFINFI